MLHNGRQVIYPHRNWRGMRQVVRNGATSLHGLQPLGQCGIVGTGICCYFYSVLLCPTTFKQPAYPAKTYSTGLGPASVPPKSAGSSTTSNQTAPNLLYNSTSALFFNQERSHKIVLLFILRMNNNTTPSIAACGVRHKTDFMSKIIKISFNVLTGYLPECG